MSEIYNNSPEMWTVDIPRRGAEGTGRPTDTVKVGELGVHIAGKIEAASERGEGHLELAWHIGNAKGAGITDAATAKHFDRLLEGMTAAKDQKAYFREHVKPTLYNLRTAPRKG